MLAARTGSRAGLVVANGDDLYGVEALRAAHHWMNGPAASEGAAVLFEVQHALSPSGGVSRAVPVLDGGRLVALEERRGVRADNGTIVTDSGAVLAPGTPVSMNLWCLRPRAIDAVRDVHAVFRRDHAQDPSAEHGLPAAIDALVRDGYRFDALVTSSRWHGVTWPEDVVLVRDALAAEMARTDEPAVEPKRSARP